jgi:5-methylcytosine-specific restriction enzyme subunit McrC
MNIPIQNIYYLLCYAWNKLEERDTVAVQAMDCHHVIDLLARVLISGMNHLFKRGLDRGYIEFVEETKRIRGKIDLSETIKKNLLLKSQIQCQFDEMNHDILHNQIIKTTIGQLLYCDELEKELKQELVFIYRKLQDISEVRLTAKSFKDVQLNQSNFFYDFLLKICELIIDNLLISEDEGESKFRDFFQDEKQMAYVFEAFVRNFYRKEQKYFKVKREDIYWLATPLTENATALLPKMQTDTSLISHDRHIVIDTKYKKETLNEREGSKKIHTENLYQMNAYLDNLVEKEENERKLEGILLYPTIDDEINEKYDLKKFRITIATINLNQNWECIHDGLLGLVI